MATLGTATFIEKLVIFTDNPRMLKSKDAGTRVSKGNGGPVQTKSEPMKRSVSVIRPKGFPWALAFRVRKKQNSPNRVTLVIGSPSLKASPVLVRMM